ncbi:DUF4834 family protein [Limnovirga soli]|uniref:DUF4834 family protein n=1 Tax=Limnovirga soli TaxID=2656915 RepID=A0A8J8FI09_9BACT|nr:DUF4834 family protein [Limnovirga soli]NNV55434.1 DUF4834 family protein [Limnovirga soli]
MIDVIATILILYLLYKLVFDFIVPVGKTASQFKSQVSQMQRMQEEQLRKKREAAAKAAAPPPQAAPKANTATVKNSTTTDGEYIDFEEIK